MNTSLIMEETLAASLGHFITVTLFQNYSYKAILYQTKVFIPLFFELNSKISFVRA